MDPQTGSPAFGVALQADFCSSASKNSILFYIDHTATLIIARSTSKSSLTVGHEGHTGRRRHDARARPTGGGPARRHHPQPDRLGEPQRGAGAADRDGGRAWQWRGTGRERGSGEGRGGARGRRGGTGRGRGSGRGCARSAQLGPVSRARTGERGLQNRSGPARTGTGTDGLGRAGTNAASRTGPGVSPAAARRIPRTAEEPGRARL